MIRLLVAGPREFTDGIYQQAQRDYPDIRIVSVATDPATAVSIIEDRSLGIDGVLFGFNDQSMENLVNVALHSGLSAAIFISIEKAADYRRWQGKKILIAPTNRELETISRYFKNKPELLKNGPDEEPQSILHKREAGRARAEEVERRESQTQVVAVGKKIVVVFGQKGGIGKTVLTISLAKSLAAVTDMRVVVVDLDMNRDYGDVLRYMRYLGADKSRAIAMTNHPEWSKGIPLPQEKTLMSWVREFPRDRRADRKIVDLCLVQETKNLFLLPPFRTIGDEKNIGYEDVQWTLETLFRHFDVVIVDAGNTLSNQSLAAMEMCDELFIMSDADLPTLDSLADFTTGTIKKVEGHYTPGLIINDIPSDCEYKLEKDLPEMTGGYLVIAKFPHDDTVAKMVATDAQVPYLGAHDIPYTREIKELLKYIFPKAIFPESKKSKSGIFQKLFRRFTK